MFEIFNTIEERNLEIKKLYQEGWTYQKIGKKYNYSRQRIHQILSGYSSKFSKEEKEYLKWHSECEFYCNKEINKNNKLHLHHLDGNHNNKTIKNLLILCCHCHIKLHHKNLNILNH